MHRPARAMLLVAVVLLACACELRAGVDVVLDRDGGGLLAVTVGADAELRRRAADAGIDPLASLADAGAALAVDGWQVVASEEEDGSAEVTLSVGFADPDELVALTTQLADALAAPELRPLEPLTAVVDEDSVLVSGSAGLVPLAGVADLGLTRAEAVAALRDGVRYAVRVTPPGEVIDAPGAVREAASVVWHVPPGERVAVQVRAERPPARGPALLAGGLVVVLLTILAVLALRRRGGGRPPGRRTRRRWRRLRTRSDRVGPEVAARYRR